MGRVDRLLSKTLPEGLLDTYGIEAAYCACLNPEEACQLLLVAAAHRTDLRAPALRKIAADMELGFRDCHRELVKSLLEAMGQTDSRGRQSIGYCLSDLADKVGEGLRLEIETAFLESRYVSVRRRGYKSCSGNPTISRDAVLRAWERFADVECAWLITKTFPVDYLIGHRMALLGPFTEGWQFSELYLRIAEVKPSVLPELKAIDPISYCYVRAKLRRPIGLREAKEIADAVRGNEKYGLLVWAYGRMGLWSALEYVESRLLDMQNERTEEIRARYHGV